MRVPEADLEASFHAPPVPGRPHVRNVMPGTVTTSVGPFIYLDVLGPYHFPAGQRVHVPDHPHTGLATISYLLDGEGWHGDDLGNELALAERSINWMASGNGIVHHEGLSERFSQTGGRLTGLQAWIMLTPDERRRAPTFIHTTADDVPRWSNGGVELTLVSGALGIQRIATSTSRDHALVVLESERSGSTRLEMPDGWEYLVHVLDGHCSVDGRRLAAHDATIGVTEGALEMTLDDRARVILLSSRRLDEPVLFGGSHVAGSVEELRAAQQRYEFGAPRSERRPA